MMDLDEAIRHCEEVATQCEGGEYTIPKMKECATEHRQLAEWLKELKAYRSRSEIPNTCGDAISRQAVLDILDDMVKNYVNENDFDKAQGIAWVKVQRLPSVTPQQRTGRWIPVGYDGYADGSPVYDWWECSECGWEHSGDEESLTAFCPNCGAKMVEPQESEDKE